MPATYVPGPNGPIVVATGPAFTTWDPANISANLALSGGNLVATKSGAIASAHTRSLASHSTGKYYCEITATSKGTTAETDAVGVMNGSEVFTQFLGHTATGNLSIGYYDDGAVLLNNVSVVAMNTWTTGDVISMAVDIGASRIWFRKNAGLWNNNAGADPAAGTNGINISAITGALYAGNELEKSGDIGTANFGASAYAQSVPSGFGNW